jgi:PAS domain S-box-containing protein
MALATRASSIDSATKVTIMSEDFADQLSSQQMSDRFDLLAEDAKEYAVFLLDQAGHLICWNPGAERLFGYPSSEVIGQHFSRFFTGEDIRNGQPEHELKEAFENGSAHSIRWQVRKDGTQFWCHSSITPLRDENKQLTSVARVMHDLTDGQAQVAQKLRGDKLAEANRSKEEFMALLSHELRNPLSPIVNALSILKQLKTEDPIIDQACNVIDRQVMQMVRLVDDLLDISRITRGKLRLIKEKVELRVIANQAAETARPMMTARQHDFSLSLPTEAIWVDADPSRLEQIVVNLLNNAAKYTPPGGLIRMSVLTESNEALIRVWDNGLGISPEMLSNIFDLFTQADGTASHNYGGLGIGLALVRTLIEMQDGRVQAYSAGLDKGSEFIVKLPLLTVIEDLKTKTVLESVAPDGIPLKILVVEDNPDSADMLNLLLRLHGHDVEIARTGPTALEMAAQRQPDLVLLDIGLPGMDGYEVVQNMREMPELKHTMICALTGYTPSDADRQRQQDTGFDHNYIKPVTLKTLLELCKTVEQSPNFRAKAAAAE